MTQLYWVNMKFCCIGVEVSKGCIIDIAPLLKCWKGQVWEKFYAYYERQNKLIEVRKVL